MLVASNITMQFSAKPLFENVSIKFGNGNRYGLIGANGAGKSTFMKILSKDLEPTHGNVSIDQDERMATLKQDQFAFEEFTVMDTVLQGHTELWEVKKERDEIYGKAEMTEEDGMRAGDLEAQFAELDGYMAEAKVGELLLGLGIATDQHYLPMSEIAPGWKLRVLLAQVLFADPDILLLDEPTNHLDINTIRWLEQILLARNCTMVIISHDRHFLNSVCTHMADLDFGAIQMYPGNYDEYMLASVQAREQQMADNAKKEAQVKQLQDFVRRFSANASKARQATSRQKQLDKIQIDKLKPSSRKHPYIVFEEDKKLYRNVVEIENLSKGYDGGEPLFSGLEMIIEVGERVAIIGPNGAGKTTLARTLAGDLEPDTGSIKWAENAEIGVYAQDHSHEFENGETLVDWMTKHAKEGDDDMEIRGTLGKLLFSGDQTTKTVDVISGGEQGRMIFGRLILQNPNVMVLDEPTNHLDMESIESLNMALEKYPGTIIFVSHDRQFVSSLATRILEFRDGKLVEYRGTYDEYLQSQGLES